MSFGLEITESNLESCDYCKKTASDTNVIIQLEYSSRKDKIRSFIQVHQTCLDKLIKRAMRPILLGFEELPKP